MFQRYPSNQQNSIFFLKQIFDKFQWFNLTFKNKTSFTSALNKLNITNCLVENKFISIFIHLLNSYKTFWHKKYLSMYILKVDKSDSQFNQNEPHQFVSGTDWQQPNSNNLPSHLHFHHHCRVSISHWTCLVWTIRQRQEEDHPQHVGLRDHLDLGGFSGSHPDSWIV